MPSSFPQLSPQDQILREETRREFFSNAGLSVGALGLASLLADRPAHADKSLSPMAPRTLHHPARARSVIYLFMAGGPSQLELFEDKPLLRKLSGQKPPASFMKGKRFAFLKGNETLLGPSQKLRRYGQSGAMLSDLLPYHREIVDDVCFVRGMQTDVFNHGPAKLFVQTGAPAPGRPSMGSWVTYGIGSESESLPGFVVLVTA
ncbi:MAG: DUF1501 domain-containing protein [Planctomycetota bacterium]